MTITCARVRELLNYDPETGVFTWAKKSSKFSHVPVGAVAGRIDSQGHRQIRLDGAHYAAHRLAFLHATGELPQGVVDHRDGMRDNNAFANLRDTTYTLNAENQRRAKVTNRAGLLGVCPFGDRFRAQIQVRGQKLRLGFFDTPELAHAAYIEAKRRLHAGCTI